jgi:hypothetical protein
MLPNHADPAVDNFLCRMTPAMTGLSLFRNCIGHKYRDPLFPSE